MSLVVCIKLSLSEHLLSNLNRCVLYRLLLFGAGNFSPILSQRMIVVSVISC
jgi:hypothetical protein